LFLLCFVLNVFSRRCVRGLTSPVTANEPTIDALFYFVTSLAYYTSVSRTINEMNEMKSIISLCTH